MLKRNKFYWKEGVTQKEIEKSLASNSFPRLRSQSNRRRLVAIHVSCLLLMALTTYWATFKEDLGINSNSYLLSGGPFSILAFLGVLISYTFIRISIRTLADAPDELLDERQLKIRNNHYRTAYLASFLPATLLVGLMIFGPSVTSFGTSLETNDGTWLFVSFFFSLASMPSMVIAWSERDI